ncbi:MAG: extracellular solute-binding protein [Nitrososphaerales archaeon]|nr:extracellular solute-binding protein [Nitrososphaerales archaeon]
MKLRNGVSTAAVAGVVIVILVLAGVAVYFYSSVPGPTSSTSTSPTTTSTTTTASAGNTLTIMSISGFSDSFYTAVGKDFEAQNPGVTVRVLTAPFSGILAQEQTLLQAHDSSVDIVTGTPSMIGTLAQFALNLNPYISQYNLNKSDIIPAMQSSNGDVALGNGTVRAKALAMMSDTMFIYYRPSIWNQYQSSLKPLNTWENFIFDEGYLYNNTGTYGAFVETATAHELWNTYLDVYSYYYQQSSMGPAKPGYGILFTNKLLPSFNSTAGVQATETLARMLNAQPSLVNSYGGFNYNNFVSYYTKGFQGKNFTMAIAWLAQFSSVNKTLNGDVAFTALPGGHTQEGGSGAAVNAYSQNPTLAFKFLQFALTPAEQVKMYDLQHALPGTFSGYKYLISEHPNLAKFFQSALSMVQAGGAEPHIISSTWALIPIIDNALASVLPPNAATPQQISTALQIAANQWIPIVKHG